MTNLASNQSDASIIRLSDDVINKIAAGEIIERPQAVVRELVDNAIDAGAKKIVIETHDGGNALIRVQDDGHGIAGHELSRAFERHATSKIKSFEDLDRLATSGFRGEALASIAAVSKVTIRSKTAEQQTGVEAILENGKVLSQKNCICPVGTIISVAEIFYALPARRKFLKTGRTELSKIKHWLLCIAPSFPDIQFLLTNDGKEELFFPAAKDFASRARPWFSGNIAEVNFKAGAAQVQALLAHPLHGASKHFESLALIVNGHAVFDKVIIRAIKDAYGIMLKPYEKLGGLISMALPPEAVDINVHPQKSEIRLKDTQAVYLLVRRSVETSLKSFSSISEPETNVAIRDSDIVFTPALARQGPGVGMRSIVAEAAAGYLPITSSAQTPLDMRAAPISQSASPEYQKIIFSNLLFVGQVFDCFLLFEKNESQAVMMDMHAAHERIRYNQIRKELLRKRLISQPLLLPVQVELKAEQCENAELARAAMERCGFEYRVNDAGVVLSAVPTIIVQKDLDKFFKKLFTDETLSDRAPQHFERLLDRVAATIACHGSIRSGKVLSKEEVSLLCQSLDEAEGQALCPHGRPIATTIARSEIDRWFGR